MRSVFTISCFAALAVAACTPDWGVHRADAGMDGGADEDSTADEDSATPADDDDDADAEEQITDTSTAGDADAGAPEPLQDSSAGGADEPREAAVPPADGGCVDGYESQGGNCRDIDECFEGTHACHTTANCENKDGSYDCTCPLGYSGGTRAGFACAPRIAMGGRFACALLGDGRVKCWGDNSSGQLGDGTKLSRLTPVFVKGLDRVVAIAAHDSDSACALRDDGRVVCWGANASGQLGDGTVVARAEFGEVPKLAGVVALSVRNTLACAVTDVGALWCWGTRGGLGSEAVTTALTAKSLPGAPPLSTVEVGWYGTGCAAATTGTVWCWTMSPNSQLAQRVGLSDVVRVALGLSACALQSSGNVVCWRDDTTMPEKVYQLYNVVSLAAGLEISYAVQADGTVYAWNGRPTSILSEYAFKTEPIDAVVVAGGGAGSPAACAVVRDGTARCWGINSAGQLGDGTTVTPAIDMASKIYSVTTVRDLDIW